MWPKLYYMIQAPSQGLPHPVRRNKTQIITDTPLSLSLSIQLKSFIGMENLFTLPKAIKKS